MRGGYLPPYLHSGLVHILGCKTFPICVVDIYHLICIVDWCLFSFTILMIPNPICVVDIYHCICTVVWCIFWGARPFHYEWWISTTVFAQWTGAYIGLGIL